MRGIFPILVTPFDQQERVDVDSLRNLVEFTIGAGVHGLGIALGSEIQKLTDPEREQVIRIVIEQARGRVPVVVNTGAQATVPAVAYSRQAAELGAAAVMCLPPLLTSASEQRAYFRALSDAVQVPIFIQDTQATPVPARLMRQIADESEQVRYAKVESPPQPAQVLAAVQASDGRLTIFGGAGGTYLIEELRRGAVGTMPWPSQPDTFVRIWELWQSGDPEQAAALHEREIVPLAMLATTGLRLSHSVHKEVLRRRGVIEHALVRSPSDPLDDITRRELDRVCDRLGIGSAVA